MTGFAQGFIAAALIVVLVGGMAWLLSIFERRRKEEDGWTGRRK